MDVDYIFLIDTRASVGLGHLSRSCSLAHELSASSDVLLLLMGSRVNENHLDFITNLPYKPIEALSNARISCEILLIDNYSFTESDLFTLPIDYKRTLIFSDKVAERCLRFDYVLDINMNASLQSYLNIGLTADRLIVNPNYNLISEKILSLKNRFIVKERIECYGLYLGSQPREVYEYYIREIINIKSLTKLLVFHDDVSGFGKSKFVEIVPFSVDVVEKMLMCDVIFGSAGVNAWERACLGVPSIYISFSHLHDEPIELLVSLGFGLRLNVIDDLPSVVDRIDDYSFRTNVLRLSEFYFNRNGKLLLVDRIRELCAV